MSEKVSFITMASDVSEFYKNKHIFITGGAGFLGIALIEKILRASPNVRKINFDIYNDSNDDVYNISLCRWELFIYL